MRRQSGFTLLELMIVILVMGLLLSLVVARGPVHSRALTLQAAAASMAQSLRLARTDAIMHDTPVRYAFDAATGSYGPARTAARMLPLGVTMTAPGRITFEPDGSTTGGNVRLTSANSTIILTVDWLTGQVAQTK